jgi:hypothetical protein
VFGHYDHDGLSFWKLKKIACHPEPPFFGGEGSHNYLIRLFAAVL